eukprot:jgi/Phyca11/52990/gw1.600.1.1
MSTITLPPLRSWTSFTLSLRVDPILALSFILDDNRPLTPPAATRLQKTRVAPTQHPVTKERKRKRKMTPAEKRAARSCCIEGCT